MGPTTTHTDRLAFAIVRRVANPLAVNALRQLVGAEGFYKYIQTRDIGDVKIMGGI